MCQSVIFGSLTLSNTRKVILWWNEIFAKIRFFFILFGNQKVKSIIVTEVTVMSPFIMYSSQIPWNFLDMEVIMIKEDVKCLSPFQLKSIRVTLLQ